MTSVTPHHVGTTVADLDRAVAFYRDVLGLELQSEFTVSGESFAIGVGVPDATARFAHLVAGGDPANGESEDSAGSSTAVRIELVEYEPTGDDCAAERVDQRGAKHLGFEVEDVDAFYEGLPDDVETVSEPQTTDSGARILFVRDPEGNFVEIITP